MSICVRERACSNVLHFITVYFVEGAELLLGLRVPVKFIGKQLFRENTYNLILTAQWRKFALAVV